MSPEPLAELLLPVLPVLDVRDGIVVHAKRGDRKSYAPLRSLLTSSSQPLAVAQALRASYGLTELYVADLNALSGERAKTDVLHSIGAAGFRIWIDPGLRDAMQAHELFECGMARVIAATESLPTSELLGELIHKWGSERLVFSLDLYHGQPRAAAPEWRGLRAQEIAAQAIAVGVTSLILLDLAQVGTGQGTGTRELCRHLRRQFPEVELITGGGIRSRQDIAEQRTCGASGVLVATALHDGTLIQRPST